MKKYISLALVALAIIAACLCLISCKKDDTPIEVVLEEIDKISFKDKTVKYNGNPKNITVTTKLKYNRLPKGIKVKYEGNGQVDVGEYEVKAIFSRNGEEIPEATKTAKLKIEKAEHDLTDSLVTFKDTTVSYNGKVQTLKVDEEELSKKGVTVTYDFHGQEPKVAGTYMITAKFSHSDTKNFLDIPDKTVTLTIEKKQFDTSTFSFNRTFTVFDGSPKSVEITGTLPEGLSVEYVGNKVISVGEHTVYAKFSATDPNYLPPADMQTTLVIINEDYSSSEYLNFEPVTSAGALIGYKVTGFKPEYTANAPYLIIPEKYDDGANGEARVIEIQGEAFKDKDFITYVHIPDTITAIGDYAFANCENLKEIRLSLNDDLSNLGEGVFQNCTVLETVSLPQALTEIPNLCFDGCSALKSIKLGPNVTGIGYKAFSGCSSLNEIYIPKKVETITATSKELSPFYNTASSFMIVLEDVKAGAGFDSCWSYISDSQKALVIYGQTYQNYVDNSDGLRKAAEDNESISSAISITVGNTPLKGFAPTITSYEPFASASFDYPTVSVKVASPAALITIEQATDANGGVATITIENTTITVYTIKFNVIGNK